MIQNNITLKKLFFFIALALTIQIVSQEGIPVYTDYLSDNLYLVHPSMAGAANTNKIRLTARKQWFGVEDSPYTQSANINFRAGDKVGLGGILYVDKNGNFSQSGMYGTFAYHLLLSRDRLDLNMLSFGISGGLIQSKVDMRGLADPLDPDPVVKDVVRSEFYYNVDVGLSYNYLEWFAHFTIKNLLPMKRDLYNNGTPVTESDNQRRMIFSVGRLFGLGKGDTWSMEPSILYQFTDQTKENAIDANLKIYKDFNSLTLWGGMSYRRSFDGAEYSSDGLEIENQNLQYVTPFIGINYGKFMFGYTYNHPYNSVLLTDGGFHQLTLGYDFGKREERWDCKCPAVN